MPGSFELLPMLTYISHNECHFSKKAEKTFGQLLYDSQGRISHFLAESSEGSLCCKIWLNILVKKKNICCFFICQPCKFSPAVDESAGVCLKAAARIVNYSCSSLISLTISLSLLRLHRFRVSENSKFSGLAIRKNIFTSKLNKVDLEGRESKHIPAFHKVTLERVIMF